MTAPPMPSMSLINDTPRKGATLPANVTLQIAGDSSSEDLETEHLKPSSPEDKPLIEEAKTEEIETLSPSQEASVTVHVSPSKTAKLRQGLVKLYMDNVQKG